MRAISPSSSAAIAPPPQTAAIWQRTSWHSPVPYLFGGLAAMVGLIAFALLILACSYWKLSTQEEERDLESGNNEQTDEKIKELSETKVYEEKILVIMAGDQTPRFLATPATPNFPSVNSHSNDDDEAD
ncbi:protein GLUTAMINE DUMPER 4-like [Cucurbita moschata]|uniref:Protein GLUTAMINE DUMPER 4-like n=1 Tax=Cucurbita moschata TaxID=3662 RepID=A0A6J1GIM5_CUCMO|nr:protein GLUTAMINE DUMPER 4-like [Cucurbita moschata]